MWPLRFRIAGFKSSPASEEDREKNQIPKGKPALVVNELPPTFVKDRNDGARNAGLGKWDVIVAVDGDARWVRSEGELFAYILQRKRPGDRIALTVLRAGKKMQIRYAVR